MVNKVVNCNDHLSLNFYIVVVDHFKENGKNLICILLNFGLEVLAELANCINYVISNPGVFVFVK